MVGEAHVYGCAAAFGPQQPFADCHYAALASGFAEVGFRDQCFYNLLQGHL